MEGLRQKKPRPSRAIPGAKKGGSKPAGPEALRAVLACKVTAGEQEAVKVAASAAGMSESAWIRRAVQEALTRADHARQVVAHLEAVGGLPSATG
jgi:hypothetical protein